MEKVTLGKFVTVLERYAFRDIPMAECMSYAAEPPILKDESLSTIVSWAVGSTPFLKNRIGGLTSVLKERAKK